MTTRRGAKGKFSIPSNFGFRRHHRDKKKNKKNTHTRMHIRVYTYTQRGGGGGGGNFGRNSTAAVSKVVEKGLLRSFRLWLRRDNSALSHPSLSSIQYPCLHLPPSNMQFRALTRQRREEQGGRREGETFWFLRRMVIHRDNLSGKLHRGWFRLDGFVTRFSNSTRWFVRRRRRRLRWFDSIRVDLAV